MPLFHGEFPDGQYTFKKYYMQNKVNAMVRKFAPKGSLEFEESPGTRILTAEPSSRTKLI